MSRQSVVTVANEQVSIVTVLQMLGVELPDDIGMGRSRKIACPFGPVYHSDGGISPAMRIYPDDNSVYCFSCSTYFSAVSLAARGLDLDRTSAAQRLLDRIGYRPLDDCLAWSNAISHVPAVDRALMADALKTFCRRITPDWATRQFDADVAAPLTRCLSVLDLVSTAQDVDLWLTACKKAMTRALHGQLPSVSQGHDVLS